MATETKIIVEGSEIKVKDEDIVVYLSKRNISECSVVNLRVLNFHISHNLLESFELQAPNLKKIDIDHNLLKDFYIEAPNLEWLDLSHNLLESFELQAPKLKWLYIDHNRLIKFEIDAPSLKCLYISNNLLEGFELQTPNLKRLDLSNNPLHILSLEESQVPKLSYLDLSGTLVNFVDSSLVGIASVYRPNIQERAHVLGSTEIILDAFFPQGHPVAEEILLEVQE